MKLDEKSLRGKGPIIISVLSILVLILTIVSLFFVHQPEEEVMNEEDVVEDVVAYPEQYYGVNGDSIIPEFDVVGKGQTLSTILAKYGLSATEIHNLVEKSNGIFNVRSMKRGGAYAALKAKDGSNKLNYFIYEINNIEYVKYTFTDSLIVERISRPVETNRKTLYVRVTSSLWESIISAGGTAALVTSMEDIFQWTVDFYGIKQGDSFSIILDENYVDGKSIGYGDIIAASYNQKGSEKFAFLYEKDDIKSYWDEKGMSLKRAFLKAPLRFSRISSKFTYRRLHPIHKVYKAHTGVDYAAPMGTPVHAVADGVITDKGYNGGGGNTLKIRHSMLNGAYVTGYLHLNSYAKGIQKGSRVRQGQVIAYVGSTGSSTGPHLDFRVWKNKKPIDPLTIGGQNGEPLSQIDVVNFQESIRGYLQTLRTIEKRGEDELSETAKETIDAKRALQEMEEMFKESTQPEHDQ